MAEGRDIHIHLTVQPGTTLHLSLGGDGVTITSGDAAADSTASSDDVVEAAIQRLEGSGASSNVRAAVDGLRALRYELRPATTNIQGKRPENYLRIIDPKHPAFGVGYLTPTYFAFGRASDRKRLITLNGAEPLTAAVKFPHIKSAQHGLDAAKLLMGDEG